MSYANIFCTKRPPAPDKRDGIDQVEMPGNGLEQSTKQDLSRREAASRAALRNEIVVAEISNDYIVVFRFVFDFLSV